MIEVEVAGETKPGEKVETYPYVGRGRGLTRLMVLFVAPDRGVALTLRDQCVNKEVFDVFEKDYTPVPELTIKSKV